MSSISSEQVAAKLCRAMEVRLMGAAGVSDTETVLGLIFRRMSKAQIRKVVADITEHLQAPEYETLKKYLEETT